MKKITVLFVAALVSTTAFSREQLRIVGSSTVYPFASYVAEEFGAVSRYPTPVVESTGTGGGMKIFCSDNSMASPDITNASRRIKVKEFYLCERNGVSDITEIMFGFDGIVLAQSAKNKKLNISKMQLLLAIAKLVPNKSGTGLVENPYQYWDQIDKTLPHRKISIYGPPLSSGTRDALEEIILQYQTEEMKVYRDAGLKGYRIIRSDGAYIPSGENDNLVVQKLTKDREAFAVFGYSYLMSNDDVISGVSINGVEPTGENIASKAYPISRSLYFYIKDSHVNKVPAMREYIEMFMSEVLIGSDGLLTEIGLIPMPGEMQKQYQVKAKEMTKLSLDELEQELQKRSIASISE
jgi:phosphate transport system substrate-binding protein